MANLQLKRDSVTEAVFDSSKSESSLAQSFLQQVVTLTAAYISHKPVTLIELNTVLKTINDYLVGILREVGKSVTSNPGCNPAVNIEDSVHEDYIVCLEDGKKLQMLKRHLSTVYNMTLEQYKERWGLSPNYPCVAPSYAKRRSKIARDTGLGSGKKRSYRTYNDIRAAG